MKGSEILRIVDAIHRDKNVDKEIVFEGIEQAILSAARKHFGEEEQVEVSIDRSSGDASCAVAGQPLKADEIGDLLGRIAAQTAKQVMIQKIREAERDSQFDEFTAQRGQIVTGQISRIEGGGTALVNLGKVEGILPRGEQIPGEAHHVGERVRAIVMDVRKAGSRVKIILSRTHPELVRRLFELEIPEVAEQVIEVRSLAREAGYRSKVAVSCYDTKIDCVGACVGVRGSRIRSVVDELAGERIDIVRWNDSLQVLVPNALQPAEVEDVILCPQLGKVIVLVRDDQLSLAIGKKGQNVRLASKLVGWDIQVLTQERLDEQIDRSLNAFARSEGITPELAEGLVAQGFFTFDELSVIEPDQLAELGDMTPEQCDAIIAQADDLALEAEQLDRLERERRRAAAEAGVSAVAVAPVVSSDGEAGPDDEASRDLEETAAADRPTQSASAEDEERRLRESQMEGSGGPHDETEVGSDPDGSDMVETMLASGAEVASVSDQNYVTEDADVGPETETTAEGLTETSAAGEEGR